MKALSNVPLPAVPERWKAGQYVYYFNHKDNGIQEEEDEGRRFEAEFTIIREITKGDVEKALIRSILDPPLEQKVIDNIEVEGKTAIDIVKTYTVIKTTIDEVAAILLENPIEVKVVEIKK